MNKCPEFQYSASILSRKLIQLKALGLGAGQNVEDNKLNEHDIEKLFQIGEIGLDKPNAVINFLFISTIYVLRLKHFTELYNLKWGEIVLCVKGNGQEFLTHLKDFTPSLDLGPYKMARLGLRYSKHKIYANANKRQCPVEAYKL